MLSEAWQLLKKTISLFATCARCCATVARRELPFVVIAGFVGLTLFFLSSETVSAFFSPATNVSQEVPRVETGPLPKPIAPILWASVWTYLLLRLISAACKALAKSFLRTLRHNKATYQSHALTDVILQLRRRAIGSLVAAYSAAVLIVIVIAAGLYTFYNADSLAKLSLGERQELIAETVRSTGFETMAGAIETAERAGHAVDGIESQVKGILRTIGESGDPEQAALADVTTELRQLTVELESSGKVHRELANALKEKFEGFPDAVDHAVRAATETRGIDLQTFVSTLITRLGAIALLLFLVQILVPMYRYNVRIATLYHSFADVLQLVPKVDRPFIESLLKVLSPMAIDFGRAPKTVIHDLAGLLSKALETAKVGRE